MAKRYDTLETAYGSFQTTFNKMYLERKPWVADDPKQVLSTIPGTVVEVKVKAGDRVGEGDLLMVYKAMKMNNNILSPRAGTVKRVCVEAGENVRNRALLIEME